MIAGDDLVEDATACLEAVVQQLVHLFVVQDVVHHFVYHILVQRFVLAGLNRVGFLLLQI